MATNRKKSTARDKKAAPRSLAIAQRGIHTGADFASMMSALMSDLIEGRVDGQVGNAVCNAGGKLLKIVEMQHRYGAKSVDGVSPRLLELAPLTADSGQTRVQ